MIKKILIHFTNILTFLTLFLIVTGGFFFNIGNSHIEFSEINVFVLLQIISVYIFSQINKEKDDENKIFIVKILNYFYSYLDKSTEETLYKNIKIISIIMGGVLFVVSTLRHYSFHSYAWDLGFFDNLIWNSANGNLFKIHTWFKPYGNALGDHFHPILLSVVPFYLIKASPIWLFVTQSFCFVVGALFLFKFTSYFLKSNSLAFIFAISYLIYLPVRRAMHFDFHENIFLLPVYFGLFNFTSKKKWLYASMFFVLTFLIKENAAFYNVFLLLGLMVFTKLKWLRRLSFLLAAFSFVIFVIEIKYLIPHFRGGGNYDYYSYYKIFGNSLEEIIANMITKPWLLVNELINYKKIKFVLITLMPVALLPLITLPGLLIIFPSYLLLLLGDEKRHSLLFHYGSDLAPFVFLAAIIGLRVLLTSKDKIRRKIRDFFRLGEGWKAYSFILIAAFLFFGRSDILKIREYSLTSEMISLNQYLASIGGGQTIKTDGFIIPHISERNNFSTGDTPNGENYYIHKKEVAEKQDLSKYALELEANGYVVYRRKGY